MQIWTVMVLSGSGGVELCRSFADRERAWKIAQDLAQLMSVKRTNEQAVPRDKPADATTGGDVIRNVLFDRSMVYVCANEKVVLVRPAALSGVKFCPACGCSWLLHFKGDASLEPEEWEKSPCAECSCRASVDGGGLL